MPLYRAVRALVTGITGSGGSYLAESLVRNHPEVEVHGLSRWHSTTSATNLASIAGSVHVHEGDLADLSSVVRVVREVRPELIFHLASHANVRASFDVPLAVLENNVMGTANLLEAVRLERLDPLFHLCSTSEVYGQVDPERVPIREDAPLNPASPYAVSKVTQDLLGASYHRSYGLRVVRTRMFAYLNPRRSDLFATAFAMQIARIEAGRQRELRHGNLDSVRTFVDARDAMEAYWLAACHGLPGEVYNIGGTETRTVGEFLELLRSRAFVAVPCVLDPALLRPADVTLQIPDVSKFQAATGWAPRIPFSQSVDDLLHACRLKVAAEISASHDLPQAAA